MVRWLSGVFGVGLVILGFYWPGSPGALWLAWFDFIAAFGAFGVAIGLTSRSSRLLRIGGPLLMAVGLYAAAIIARHSNLAPSLLISWNFFFAACFLMTGIGAAIAAIPYGLELGSYRYGPYVSHSNEEYGASYPYSWASTGLMGGYDFTRNRGEHSGRGPRNFRRSDIRIEEDVNAQLTEHDGLDASDISVQVKSQEVWLEGRVDRRRDKRLAEEIAESVLGVREVKNELKVGAKISQSSMRVA